MLVCKLYIRNHWTWFNETLWYPTAGHSGNTVSDLPIAKILKLFLNSGYYDNYTLYKNPGFWLVNSRCIFRVFSYLGLISFISTTAGVFAWRFNFFFLCAVVFAKTYFTFLPSRASNRQIHSEYFFFTFIRKVTWLIKFETRKCSDVNVFHFFTLAYLKPPNSSGIPIKNNKNKNSSKDL